MTGCPTYRAKARSMPGHNIFIDEFGWAYLSGCNINGGGFLFVDVFTNPGQPEYVGKGPFVYSHDLYARNNLVYSADIGAGYFSIHDVTDKTNSIQLGIQQTELLATHNTWLSDDGTICYTTDETGNAPIGSYDVSDPTDIQELDQFRPFFNLGLGPVPHNVFVWDDFLIISYYTEGCIVVDAQFPDNLIQVGNFDTFLSGTGGFSGAWGAYPYFPSGLVAVSDQSNGLFVLEPNYIRACYLEGTVTDASNGNPIVEAKIDFLDELTFADTDILGEFRTGIATAATYDIRISKPGYATVDTSLNLENGELITLDVALQPLASFNLSGAVVEAGSGSIIPNAVLRLENEEVSFDITADENGNFTLNNIFEANLAVIAGKWGYQTKILDAELFNEANNSLTVELEPGYEDIFLLDLGWVETGVANQGRFELAIPPNGISFTLPDGTDLIIQVGEDSPNDPGNGCYLTDNNSNLEQGWLESGTTRITSPYFDGTSFESPAVSYETYFFNVIADPNNPTSGNDRLRVSISNGDNIVELETIEAEDQVGDDFIPATFNLNEYIEITDSMQLIFNAVGGGTNDFLEAAVDNVKIFDNPIDATQEIVASDFDLAIFPNPSSTDFNVSYNIKAWEGEGLAKVYNALGQLVLTQVLEQEQGQIEFGAKLEQGVYLLQIQNGLKLSESIKLIKH